MDKDKEDLDRFSAQWRSILRVAQNPAGTHSFIKKVTLFLKSILNNTINPDQLTAIGFYFSKAAIVAAVISEGKPAVFNFFQMLECET